MNLKPYLTNRRYAEAGFFYLASIFLSFGRYLFHLILLRLLTPAEYGEFLAYLSLIYVLSIPNGTITNLVTKEIATRHAKQDNDGVVSYLNQALRRTVVPTTFIALTVILLSIPLATLFKATTGAFILLGINVLFVLPMSVIKSYFSGMKQFFKLSLFGLVELLATIAGAYVFIKNGFGATGAVAGQVFALFLSFCYGFFLIVRHLGKSFQKITTSDKKLHFSTTFTSSFIFTVASALIISADVLVVRAVYDQGFSADFSSLTVMGRVLYFFVSPLVALALPVATFKHSSRSSTISLYRKLLGLVSIISLAGVLIYYFLPTIVIDVFAGTNYLHLAGLLFYPAVYYSSLCFSQLSASFGLATDRKTPVIGFLALSILIPLVIAIFHPSLSQIFVVGSLLNLFYLLLFGRL